MLEELRAKAHYNLKESQVHRRLADIVSQAVRAEEQQEEEQEEQEVVVVQPPTMDNDETVISVHSNISYDT